MSNHNNRKRDRSNIADDISLELQPDQKRFKLMMNEIAELAQREEKENRLLLQKIETLQSQLDEANNLLKEDSLQINSYDNQIDVLKKKIQEFEKESDEKGNDYVNQIEAMEKKNIGYQKEIDELNKKLKKQEKMTKGLKRTQIQLNVIEKSIHVKINELQQRSQDM